MNYSEILRNSTVYSENIECHRQIWRDGSFWLGYENKPRDADGLVFSVSDIKAEYTFSDGKSIKCTRGDCIYIPKGSYYTVKFINCGNGIDLYTINFLLTDTNSNHVKLGQEAEIISSSTQSEIINTISELADVCLLPYENRLKKQCLFLTALNLLCENRSEADNAFSPISFGVARMKKEWNKNDPVKLYASLCGMNEASFYLHFKKWAGTTPIAYRNGIRIAAAKSMLKNSNLTVSKISKEIGFDDPYYFSRLFKKEIGMSPREYRQSK